jgi:hypothetical protein
MVRNVGAYQMAFQAMDITSLPMRHAIEDWYRLYYLQAPTKEEDPCQQIPYTIVRKLIKATFSEYSATSKDAFASQILDALQYVDSEAMQQAFIGGESFLKPVPIRDGFRFTVGKRSNLLIFGRDAAGMPMDIGISETSVHDKFYYTLLERRTVDARGYLTIKNALYRSYTDTDLGQPVELNSLPQYADLQEAYTFQEPVGSTGVVFVRTPMENCVDGSLDAVSVYAAAVGLIHGINRNEAQLNGEFDRAKSRLIVSADMFKKDKKGKAQLVDDIFTAVDGDLEDTGVTIFSPAIREQSFLARKQDYLRSAENIIGLKRGLLSEVEAVERTAKEITSSEGDYSLTITDFQKMWERVVRETMCVCGILGKMYHIPGAHEVARDQVIISWGNGVLFDEEGTRLRMLSEVQAGLLQPERYLGFTYKLPCDTAAQRARIRKDYMPEVAGEPEEDI